jgi:hypothetical protein
MSKFNAVEVLLKIKWFYWDFEASKQASTHMSVELKSAGG